MGAKEKKRLYDIAYRKANPNKIKRQKISYYQSNKDEKRIKSREYNKTHSGIRKKYNKSPKGQMVMKTATKKYREQNKIKTKAHYILNYAVATGRIIRGRCEVCGTNKNIEAHHDDYFNPLEVRWLCHSHHCEHHRKERCSF